MPRFPMLCRNKHNSCMEKACRSAGFQFVEKASLFHKLKPNLKWKRGLSPLFQAFFPLQPDFFLNQAAVFRQSQSLPLGRLFELSENEMKKHCERA